jgi:hypothetical protein
VLAREGSPHGEISSLFRPFKVNDGSERDRTLSLGGSYSADQVFVTDIEMARKSLRSPPAVWHILSEWGESAARPDHRVEQASGRGSIMKFQAVGDDVPHSEMLRQRTHQVIESLANQHNVCPRSHKFLNLFNAFLFEMRLQFVLEELFSQQIQAIAGYAPKNGMDDAGGKFAIGCIKERAQHRHQEDQTSAPKTVRESLSIPREEGDRSDHSQIEQAPLNAPVNGGGRTGVVVQLVQSRV